MTGFEQPRPRSMARRVMWATALSAAAGGLLAATIAIFAIDTLVADNDDQRLRGAAHVLAGEIDEQRAEGEHGSLDEVLEDENGELVTSGIRLAVFEKGRLIAGDPWVPMSEAGACTSHGEVGRRIRACGRSYERWTLVAAQLSDRQGLRGQFALAGLVALLVATCVALLLGWRLTRWATTPLRRLSIRLQDSDPDQLMGARSHKLSQFLEVRQVEEALDHLMERVAVLLDQARRFAADAAHELRTPLAALATELDLLREDLAGEDEQRAGQARARAGQLQELIDRLLLLASPVEELRAGFEPISCDEVIRELVEDMPVAERNRVRIQSESEGLVSGDASLLRSMIGNAVANALKFSAPGPVTITVDDRSDHVAVVIADGGPGIPTELRQRVFEPFFRRRADATPGHGLGLALIAHIARAHRGSARFIDGQTGATLLIRLPGWTEG